MANFRLLNNQSNAYEATTVLNQPRLPPNSYLPPDNTQKINRYISSKSTLPSLRFPLDLPEHHLIIRFGKYERNDLLKVARLENRGELRLPMPFQLVDAHGVQYTVDEIGMILGGGGQAVIDSMKKQYGNLSNMSDLGKKVLSDPSSILGGIKGAGGGIGQAVGAGAAVGALQNAGGNQLLNGLSSVLGIAPNQFLTVLFKGPAYKKFQFHWKLSPNNEEESRTIQKIWKKLNHEMAAELTPTNLFFTYPSIFTCYFTNKEQMYEFKPAVCVDLQSNFTGSGMPAFYHTKYPESLEIRASFLELEFWLKGDWGNVD
jgi:hypothetical protein